MQFAEVSLQRSYETNRDLNLLAKLFRASVIYTLGPQIPRVINLLLLPVLTEHLTANDYGVYGLLIAYFAPFTALKDLGLNVVISNVFYRYPKRFSFYWERLYGLLSAWSVVLAVVLMGVIYMVLPGKEMHSYWLITFLYCFPVAALDVTVYFGNKFFHLRQKPLTFVLITVTNSLITIAINYVLIKHYQMGYMAWFISAFVSSLFSFLVYVYLIVVKERITPVFFFSRKWISKSLAISLPVLPHTYSAYLMEVASRVIMDFNRLPIASIGVFNFATGFASYFQIFSNSLALAAGPMYIELFSKRQLKDELQARNMTMILQLVVLCTGFMIALWIKEIFIVLIRNPDLASSYKMTAFLILAGAFRPMYFGPICKLEYLEKTKVFWRISFVAGMINVVGASILIPFLQGWGAVIALFAGNLYICFSGYFLKDFKGNNQVNYHELEWLATTLVVVLAAYFTMDVAVVYKALITLLVGGSVGVMFLRYRRYFKVGQ